MPAGSPLVSIVVPTFNEEADIRETLDSLCLLKYRSKEIIIVDDSTDSTPRIVKEYANRGICFIHRPANTGGRSGARNRGIREARGDIVVVLNADVLLPPDFLDRIIPHYAAGYDCVLVDSCVKNQERLFPRFIQALHREENRGDGPVWWSEGFSARRQVLLDAGLFPEHFPIPLVAGEDGVLGEKLSNSVRVKIDRSITVHHNAPWQLSVFWKMRKERGMPYVFFFVRKMTLPGLFIRMAAKTLYYAAWLLTLVPWMASSFRLCRYSRRRTGDFLGFLFASFLDKTASVFGAWQGILKIILRKGTNHIVHDRQRAS